jgi:hypothetical protein
MKKDADLRGADETPSSSTCGTDLGSGLGSTYGLSLDTASRWDDIVV